MTELVSTPNIVEISVTTTGQRNLVISEMYYPAGWRTYLDGEEVECKRANYLLRSIEIPAGTHKIIMRSEPPGFKFGFILTSFGYLLLVGISVNTYITRKKEKT